MTKAFRGLNRLFDIGAYNPNENEGISEACELEGQCTRDERARNEGTSTGWAGSGRTPCRSSRRLTRSGRYGAPHLLGLNCDVVKSESGALGIPGPRRRGGRPPRRHRGVCDAMIKQAPGIGGLVAMALFTISVFAILMSLWMAFGGRSR